MKPLINAISISMFMIIFVASCVPTSKPVLATDESQVKLRKVQSRAFDTTDRAKMLRTVIATLQDLSFIIDKADDVLGTVTATKLNYYRMRMTVSVRPRGDSQLLVRANAQYNLQAVEDPEPYQQFFNSLSQAIFLEAHQVY